jgi:hypothetical protein
MVCYQYYFCAYFYESTMQILNIKKSKQISAETFLGNGQLLLSEKYHYEVVGAHNVTFSQLT